MVQTTRMRGNGQALMHSSPKYEEEFLYCAVAVRWNGLPREGGESLAGDTEEQPGINPMPCSPA